MNDTPLVFKGCMTVVALSLILQYAVHSLTKVKGRGGGGKVHCHWRESTSRVTGRVDSGGTLLFRAVVVVIPLLLVISGDVEMNPGPEVTSMKALLNALHPVRASWYKIGLELDIPHTELDCFERKHSDPTDLMCEVLKYWFKTAVDPHPTWEAVVTALRSPIVNELSVAKQLESNYCTPVHHKTETLVQTTVETQLEDQTKQFHAHSTPDSESPATSSARCNSSSSPPPIEASQKPPFGCGCGSCTLVSFIERGCPTPFSSKNTFPYLKLSGLTDEQQESLRERLRFETREIMMRFQELVSATINSLIRRNVSVDKLVPHVMTLGAFDPVLKTPQVPLFQDCVKKLKDAGTISKVFMVLNDYFSFFNYDIIEHIVKVLGTDEDKAELQKYKDNFNQYAKRRIFECGSHFGPESELGNADIFVKLDSRYDNYTVAEIKGFCRKLSETLHLSSKGVLRLCRVENGCIHLTFQVPSFVQREIFPLSSEQEKTLKAEGVIKLTCGEYQYQERQHDIDARAMSQDDEEATCTELTIKKRIMEPVKAVYIESLISKGNPPDRLCDYLAQQLTLSFLDQYQCLSACDRQGIVREKHRELLLIVDHNLGTTVLKDAPRKMGNAREFSVRLATFRRMPQFWRKVNPSAEALAQVGFMYLGQEDRVHCFSCGVIISDWDQKDPLREHFTKSPSCTFLRENFAAQVQQFEREHLTETHNKYANSSARLHSFASWPLGYIATPYQLASVGFFYTGLRTKVQCFSCGLSYEEWKRDDTPLLVHHKLSPLCKFLNALISKGVPTPTPITGPLPPSRYHKLSTKPDWTNEQIRQKSFKHASAVPVSSEECAKAGLYFIRHPDVMRCFCCDVVLEGWIDEDIPVEKHREANPHCKFLLDFFPTKLEKQSFDDGFDPSSLPEPIYEPQNSPTLSLSRRLSQLHWETQYPLSDSQYRQLSSYHSDLTPSSEHRYTVPPTHSTTGYVHQSLQPSILSAQSVPPSQPPSYHSRLTATLDLSMSSAISNQTASPAGSICQYSTASSFNQGSFSTSKPQPASSQYAPPSGSSLPPQDKFVGYSSHVPSPSTGEPLLYSSQGRHVRLPPSYHLQRTPSLSLPPEPARMNLIQLPPNYTQAPAASEEDNKVCVVCMDAPLQMVLVPCGHMCVCEECAQQINQCPVCHKPTQSTMKVIIPY